MEKVKKRRLIGLVLVALSILLLSGTWRLVILGVDTTAPTFVSTTPFDKASGNVPVDFLTTKKYSCRVTDSGSGVSQVIYTDTQVQMSQLAPGGEVALTRVSGTAADGVWEASFPGDVTYDVLTDYSFTFWAYDVAGNLKPLTGTFRIYTALQGKWYINDIEATSPTQTIWLKTSSITFKFVKSVGVEDSKITCTAQWGTTTRTLSNSAAGTWTHTETFGDGTYTITLKASDGTTTITLSLYTLQIGEAPSWLTLDFVSGILLGAVGLFLIFQRK